MLEHEDLFTALRIFIRLKGAPQQRLHTERVKETCRNAIGDHTLWLICSRQIKRPGAKRDEQFKGLALFTPLAQAPRCDSLPVDTFVHFPLVDHQQTILIGKGEWMKNYRLDRAEDRGVRTDSQRQREGRDKSKARLLEQHSRAETQVLDHRVLPSVGL